MTRRQLVEQIKTKRSFLCIGLDPDIEKLPKHLLSLPDPIFEFNKQIIEATHDLCVAYKPNTAFYECFGVKGWNTLQRTFEAIPKNCFSIADAKRGDIGNTSSMYARAFFNKPWSGFDFDAVTVSPYMGEDSVAPFLEFENKWVIVLGHTSNKGSNDFQKLETPNGQLYMQVINTSKTWGTIENMMYVIGATQSSFVFKQVRNLVPDHFLLVPGIGAQGGSLEEVCEFGLNNEIGLLVNSSRQIIYASSGEDFAEAARREAINVQQQMQAILEKRGLL